jgi:hypothetical protein
VSLQLVPLVVYTNSKSLYKCLVKLGTIQEKCLIIDIISLRQFYETKEIAEVKWIAGNTNLANTMTKSKVYPALKSLIDTNTVNIQAFERVERASPRQNSVDDSIVHVFTDLMDLMDLESIGGLRLFSKVALVSDQ